MSTSTKTGYWDHKTKPSTFVIVDNGKEVYRGSFKNGYSILTSEQEQPHSGIRNDVQRTK